MYNDIKAYPINYIYNTQISYSLAIEVFDYCVFFAILLHQTSF